MHNFFYNWFFAVYGDGSYGRSIYGDDGSASGLANTGFWLLLVVTAACLLIFLALLVRLWRSRLLSVRLSRDIFNYSNETFPQEERYLKNDYSINLPAQYVFKKRLRKSWINIVNPFRGLLVMGSPGSGKSW